MHDLHAFPVIHWLFKLCYSICIYTYFLALVHFRRSLPEEGLRWQSVKCVGKGHWKNASKLVFMQRKQNGLDLFTQKHLRDKFTRPFIEVVSTQDDDTASSHEEIFEFVFFRSNVWVFYGIFIYGLLSGVHTVSEPRIYLIRCEIKRTFVRFL